MRLKTTEFVEQWLADNIQPEAFGAEYCLEHIAVHVDALLQEGSERGLRVLEVLELPDLVQIIRHTMRTATDREIARLIDSN